MEMPSEVRVRPDLPAEERATREAIKLILKLRWMGLDEEAEQMQAALQKVDLDFALLIEPCDTD